MPIYTWGELSPPEVPMKVADVGAAQMTEQVQALNKMLQSMTSAQMGLDEKMMKVAATAKVTGLGDHFDMYV